MRVVLEKVSFGYPGSTTPLIRDFSYEFAAGTVTAVIGPSGTGKSTLLDLIGELQLPDSGLIELHDLAGEDISPRCSWVLQNNMLLGGRTAVDNAALGLIATGSARRESRYRARNALKRLGLSDRANEPPERLSGGEAQRVTIARCLLSRAPILLADEPTGQLDPSNSQLVFDALRHAASNGKAVILATHDPVLAGQAHAIVDLAS